MMKNWLIFGSLIGGGLLLIVAMGGVGIEFEVKHEPRTSTTATASSAAQSAPRDATLCSQAKSHASRAHRQATGSNEFVRWDECRVNRTDRAAYAHLGDSDTRSRARVQFRHNGSGWSGKVVSITAR